MKIHYVLTAFSPAMFGEAATAHIRLIPLRDAKKLVTSETKLLASRVSHERLAKNTFPELDTAPVRYSQLSPGVNAIHMLYRGPMIPDDGAMPAGGMITCYLIESEEYQEDA